MSTKTTFYSAIFVLFLTTVFSQRNDDTPANLLIVVEENDKFILNLLNEVVPFAEHELRDRRISVNVKQLVISRDHPAGNIEAACAELSRGVHLILDLTWTGWIKLKKLAREWGIAYVRGESVINPYVQTMDEILLIKNTTDCALIFEYERELNQTLYYLIGNSIIRLVVIDEFNSKTVAKVGEMRPLPSYYVIYASTEKMEEFFKTAIDGNLVNRDGVWNLVFTDFNYKRFSYIANRIDFNISITVISMKNSVCCNLLHKKECECNKDFNIFPAYFSNLVTFLTGILNDIEKDKGLPAPISVPCNYINSSDSNPNNVTNSLSRFSEDITERINTYNNITLAYYEQNLMLTYHAEIEISTFQNGDLDVLGSWITGKHIVMEPDKKIVPAKRYFRVGTAEAIPWATKKLDSKGEVMKDANGNIIFEGYCIELIQRLSELMDFDYDLVIPQDNSPGMKLPSGEWTGLVGDLAKGETDIIVAALTMTSEREEVVDFVAPYFEQSGILITIRKPVLKTSLFKFMTVLRLEVWLSIVGALTVTGFMIWILDKYSPYSARNNKELYPYPCREFTLKESFWFALTSFTPQGGGEAPKALSSRTLVAAYWLFVVLMLATFTANLAAFLTVERMQSPVQSLEELARQSRINYTVLNGSSIHQYFINMQKAEDKLYEVWKEITLNSTSDHVEFRVWDYPIKEQYGHILQAIEQAGPVMSVEEGFKKVVDSENAEFAFIHDSSEIKYAVTKNCNLTEIGETFAEQPYAIAVQQGSHLQEEISRKILDLQKDRYFERLSMKYWNQTLRHMCPNSDENEGITLESLGGVFIATLIGLALAMLTLAGEVIYYKRKNAAGLENKEKSNDKIAAELENDMMIFKKLTSQIKLKPAPVVPFDEKPFSTKKVQVSHISVYPRPFPFRQ